MKDFSSLSVAEKTVTSRDQLIKKVSVQSGLGTEQIKKMYENFEASGKDWTQINESFTDWLNPNILIGFKDFFKSFINKASMLNKQSLTETEKYGLTDELISSIWEIIDNKQVDSINLLNIVSNILILKDPFTFGKIVEETGFIDIVANNKVSFDDELYDEYQNLYESFKPLRTLLSENQIPSFEDSNLVNQNQKVNNKDTKLYEGLRDLLAKNNKRWGNSYHIDNSYNKIMDYINNEIDNIQNAANLTSVSNTYQKQFFSDIFMGNISPIYRDVNNIKQVIPDIQTLVFDLMAIVQHYIWIHDNDIPYINATVNTQYLLAVKNLYSLIASSKKTSYVLYSNRKLETGQCIDVSHNDGIFAELKVDVEKFEGYNFMLQHKSVVDIVYIMKSCTQEFNLKIRPALRNYVTKTFEILKRIENISSRANN